MTSLHSSLRRRHGLEKHNLAHHRIALRYPRFMDDYLVCKEISVGFGAVGPELRAAR